MASVLLNDFDYDIVEFNASELRNQKLIKEKLDEINGSINIMNFMCQKRKYIGIIMDEIDGMSSGDRGGVSELINIMYKSKKESNSPFICITNTLDKKLKPIKDKSCTIKMQKPNYFYLLKVVKHILKSENIKLDDELILKYIIEKSQSDFRRLINLCEYVFNNKSLNLNTLCYEDQKKYIDTFEKKHEDLSPYSCVEKLLNIYKDLDHVFTLFSYDKNLISLLTYENFLEYILKNRKGTNEEKAALLADLYNNYSEADLYDREIYINQHFGINKYNCVLKCAIPSYSINEMKKYSCNKVSKINYSSLINKTSLEYLNYKYTDIINKKILNYCDPNMVSSIADIIMLLICEYDIDNGLELLKYYKITFDEFQKFIKITSIDFKKQYTTKIKNIVKKFYETL